MPPVILCHGWPEDGVFPGVTRSRPLSEAGDSRGSRRTRRGYGARPTGPSRSRPIDMEHLTGDHRRGCSIISRSTRAIFVGHDWGGFIVWQMPLRHNRPASPGVIGVNTAALRSPCRPTRSSCSASGSGDSMYIVQFQDPGGASRTRFSAAASSRCFDRFHAQAVAAQGRRRRQRRRPRVSGASAKTNLGLSRKWFAAYDAKIRSGGTPILSPEERKVFRRYLQEDRLLTGGINWYRQTSPANWAALRRARPYGAGVAVADDHGRERRRCCRPSAAERHGEDSFPDLEEISGARQRAIGRSREKPDEVSAKLDRMA